MTLAREAIRGSPGVSSFYFWTNFGGTGSGGSGGGGGGKRITGGGGGGGGRGFKITVRVKL